MENDGAAGEGDAGEFTAEVGGVALAVLGVMRGGVDVRTEASSTANLRPFGRLGATVWRPSWNLVTAYNQQGVSSSHGPWSASWQMCSTTEGHASCA
jgi:hypothetical protein